MTDHKNPSAKQAARKARDERLAAALRENLRKRKQQGRVRSPDGQAPDPEKDSPNLDD